jgi:tau tubulin kinase
MYISSYTFQMLIGLFERCMKRRGVKESDPYDWEKVPNVTSVTDNAVPPAATTSPAILSRPATGILGATRITDNLVEDNLITSLDNNQENIEPDNKRELEVRCVFLLFIAGIRVSGLFSNFWIKNLR